MQKFTHIDISWSISRGHTTQGYNICRLDAGHIYNDTQRRWRCIGGGYDMVGSVFGMWLTDTYQKQLKALFDTRPTESCGYAVSGYSRLPGLYGITLSPEGVVNCDGACGIGSMQAIAAAIGLDVHSRLDKKGNLAGFIVFEEVA